MKKVLRFVLIIFTIGLGIVLAGGATFYFRALHYSNDAARKNDVAAFERDSYEYLYVTMYSAQEASAFPFEYFMGKKTYKTEHCYQNLRDYTDYVGNILVGESGVETVFSLFDPSVVNQAFLGSSTLTQKAYQSTLKEIIAANADVNFTFLLPVYSLEYWCGLKEKNVTEALDSYLLFCNEFQDLTNVKIYYLGNREWLIGNPANYVDEEGCTEDVLNHIVALTLFNDAYRISGDNLSAWLTETKELIGQERTEIDLSEYEIVFFGDSIVGNYSGSLSIPGIVAALSEAETYNCAIGGQSASEAMEKEKSGFGQSVSYFLGEQTQSFTDKEQFYAETERFHKADHGGKKLCFVLNYGINDYYAGRTVSGSEDKDIYSYKGAMKAGIERLLQAYPQAEIVLVTPNFVQLFESGKQILSEQGDVLTAYVNAGIGLAEEMGIHYIDNYSELEIEDSNCSQYLEDGTHLNEYGRYKYADILMEYLTKK